MRLCYVANPNTIHVQRWLAHFARAGHDVHLAVVNPVTVDRERFAGIEIHELRTDRRRTAAAYAMEIVRLRRLVARLRPDVVHAHYVARYGWLAAVAGVRPLILTAWGGDVLPRQGAFNGAIRKLLTPYTLRKAVAITVDAPDVLEICRRYASPGARLETITFGADLSRFTRLSGPVLLRDRLGIAEGCPVVLSTRIFSPLYNIDVIVRAIPAVLREHPTAVFVLQNYATLGNTAYEESLRRLVDTLGLAPHVRFVGELRHDEMPELYNVADVVVSVPTSDGVPATFFEAMGCRVPIVASDLPAYDGLIEHGRTGIRVRPRDVDALSHAVSGLLSDAGARQQISDAAYAVVLERGNFGREMSRVEAMYADVAGH